MWVVAAKNYEHLFCELEIVHSHPSTDTQKLDLFGHNYAEDILPRTIEEVF